MKNEEQDTRVDHTQYDPLPLVAKPLATASTNEPESDVMCDGNGECFRIASERDELLTALRVARAHLFNAKFDIEAGVKKATALATIEGGLRVVRAAIDKAEA